MDALLLLQEEVGKLIHGIDILEFHFTRHGLIDHTVHDSAVIILTTINGLVCAIVFELGSLTSFSSGTSSRDI